MHGHPFHHGGIARRQGLSGLIPSGFNPFDIFGDPSSSSTQSSTTASSSSTSSTSASPSPSTVPSSSSVTSSSSLSSTSPSPSSTPLYTYPTSTPSPTPTPTPTPTPSHSVLISSSDENAATVTSIVPALASGEAAPPVPKSFLENKSLAAGVFTIVGIISLAILIMIGTIWIRSASRRRLNREALDASAFDPSAIVRDDNEKISSLEKLRRVNSTSSSGFSHNAPGQSGVGRGGYPAPPVALIAPQNYRQTSPYHGQPPEGPGYDGRYPSYLPPRSLDLVYNPAHTHLPPHVNIIAATPSTGSRFGDEISPIRPSGQNMPATPQHASLLNSPPISPSGPGENATGFRGLDTQEMPIAPPLPAKFGSDENDDEDDDAYGGIGSDHDHEMPRSLKVANQ